MNQKDHREWEEAQRRCRLSDEEVRMAKELGFRPKSLIKNIPAPSQKWKAPVNAWVRMLYEEKIGSRKPAKSAPAPAATRNQPIELRNPAYPWPDRPDIPERVVYEPSFLEDDDEAEPRRGDFFQNKFAPPSDEEIDEQNTLMLRRQCLFRWAARWIAMEMSRLPEVEKVAAFGAVAQPLEMEVPRFSEFRRHHIEVLHECADLDLAVWTTDLSRLKELKRARERGLSLVHDTPYGGVAHQQVDVHILNAGNGVYKGRLCNFGECPKPRKQACFVPGCGAQPFLQQFEGYSFSSARFELEPKVTLFDRTSKFMVHQPAMDAKPTRVVYDKERNDLTDEDLPF